MFFGRRPSRRRRRSSGSPLACGTPRVAAVHSVAADALEDRTLLAATLTVDASDGGAVMVDSAEYCEVVVTSAADIGTLTVNGDSSEIRVEIRGGASVSSVQFNGGAGAETLFVEGDVGPITFNGGGGDDVLTIAGGAMVNQLTYDGGDGADDLNIGGSVQGTVSVQGGAGRDRVFINGGQIGGDVGGNLGDGNDQFRLRSGGQVVNFDVDFGDGQNRFVLNSGGQVDGNFKYTGGRGSDTIRLVGEQGATEIDGNFEALINHFRAYMELPSDDPRKSESPFYY